MSRSGGRVAAAAVLAVAALAVLAAYGELPARQEAPDVQEVDFPHEEHRGLFPLCTGCHEAASRGAAPDARLYPPPETCVRCHDGDQIEWVNWDGPTRRTTNLAFDHAVHDSAAADDGSPRCVACHTPEGEDRMAVAEGPLPDRCLSCHEHRAEEHYVDAACSTCHRPLAESGFGAARIRDLPEPDSHDEPAFLPEEHGRLAEAGSATCAVCHTRERCTSCHVVAEPSGTLAELPKAPADMELPPFEARYPTPESHERAGWVTEHGEQASVESCSTCHARQSCTTCHAGERPAVVARLADAGRVAAPGVEARRSPPESHASPFFPTDHGADASARSEACAACHTEATCTECHASESGSGFHPANYLARHASESYGRRLECSSCHDVAVFCRDCHEQIGMGSRGRLDEGFHDGQAGWLFRHGQAARQALESCASCHAQRDCLQCHSERGAFGVNPHGEMDLERFADRNREVCFACHLSDPLNEGGP